MKKRIPHAVAVFVLIGLPWTALCGEKTAGPSSPAEPALPERVAGSCRTIAAILSVYPAFEVRTSAGMAREAGETTEAPGCRVLAAGPASVLAGEVAPGEALRELLRQDGWQEDPGRAADGPGATAFALRKDGIVCVFGGGAQSGIEEGKFFTAERYEFEARCRGSHGLR